ncbi:MAG TPA: response regulator transcription factor [Dermatophilaceae bacterium]|nr:response regulator transcription factor [Dermatophilaceae bacterium]
MTIRVVVADDQPLMRSALRIHLDAEPDIEVVGEAADGLQAVAVARRLRPDVALIDIRMPGLDGIQATRRLVREDDAVVCRVLVLTTFDLDEYVIEALRAGASGFLLKDATPEELVHAVRVIFAGEALVAPAVTRRLLDRFARLLPPTLPAQDSGTGLTNRESSVLRLVAAGLTNAEIADSLHVAQSSVKTHIGHLLAKLGVTDRVHLVIYAYETGLIQPRPWSPG